MVVNALTSPGMIAASLACLRPGGCFVEIGKRGIWGPAAIAAARPDVRYRLMPLIHVTKSIGHALHLQQYVMSDD